MMANFGITNDLQEMGKKETFDSVDTSQKAFPENPV